MTKQNYKASPLGRLHSDSVKRNAPDSGPKPAEGYPASYGSAPEKKEPEKKR